MTRVRHLALTLVPFLLGTIVAVLVLNAAVAASHLPEYAAWTGIRPLEEKLHKLARFSSHGEVDGLILGSSISDFGIDAELLSKEMTAATGKPYRVFNFSTGGTELVTTPTLYRMARTVSKPRTLYLSVPEEIKRGNEITPENPDYTLRRAPIGTAIAHPWLFPFEKRFYDVPLVRYAPPLRDRLVFGGYKNLPTQGSDLYWIDEYGDTVSYSYQTNNADLKFLRDAHTVMVAPLTRSQMSTWSQQKKVNYFFNGLDIDAMSQLRKLTAADGCRIVIVAHDVASDYYPDLPVNSSFTVARRQFYSVLAAQLHAKVVDVDGEFKAQKYMITDSVHLNRYGSEAFTRLLEAALTHAPKPPSTPRAVFPPLPNMPSSDPTVSGFTALIASPQNPGMTKLRLQILRNPAIPPLPNLPLQVMLRLPDNKDVTAPARLTSKSTVEATFRGLPTGPNLLYLGRIVYEAGGRLVAHNQPVASYSWSK